MIRFTLILACFLMISSCDFQSTEISGERDVDVLENKAKKSLFCCVDWSEVRINGENLIGADLETFLGQFSEVNFEKSDYFVACGFLSEEEQGEKFYSHKSNFIEVVSYEENGKIGYTTIKVNVDLLLAENYKLTIDGLVFHKSYRPTVSIIFSHWNIDSDEYDSSHLTLSDGFSDDALILHFNKSGMLVEIEYWSPC